MTDCICICRWQLSFASYILF